MGSDSEIKGCRTLSKQPFDCGVPVGWVSAVPYSAFRMYYMSHKYMLFSIIPVTVLTLYSFLVCPLPLPLFLTTANTADWALPVKWVQRSVGLWSNAVLSGGGVVINTGFSMNFRNMPTWNYTQQEQSEGRQEDGHSEILARVYFGKLWLLELKCRSFRMEAFCLLTMSLDPVHHSIWLSPLNKLH